MCAICGIGILRHSPLKDSDKLKQFFTNLLCACQDGGRSATGIAFLREKQLEVFRRGVSASEFIKDPKYQELLNIQVNQGLVELQNRLYSMIGHCRIPTKGSPLNNFNNHPIVVGDVVGVHNGCIGNDDRLFAQHNLKRIAQVDTEIIFSLLSNLTENRKKTMQSAIKETCSLITGSYACAVQSASNPYNLYLFRAFNGTEVRIYKDAGLIVFATSGSYISSAARNLDLGNFRTIPYKTSTGINFNLYLENLSRFELESGNGARTYYE